MAALLGNLLCFYLIFITLHMIQLHMQPLVLLICVLCVCVCPSSYDLQNYFSLTPIIHDKGLLLPKAVSRDLVC